MRLRVEAQGRAGGRAVSTRWRIFLAAVVLIVVPVGLLADFAAFLMAVYIVKWLFG